MLGADDGEEQADAESAENLIEVGHLPANIDADAAWRVTGGGDGLADLPRGRPQVLVLHVRGQADHALHVVAVDLARHYTRLDFGDILELHRAAVVRLDWNQTDVAHGFHAGVRDLDLNLIADAAAGRGPVNGRREPARRS